MYNLLKIQKNQGCTNVKEMLLERLAIRGGMKALQGAAV